MLEKYLQVSPEVCGALTLIRFLWYKIHLFPILDMHINLHLYTHVDYMC